MILNMKQIFVVDCRDSTLINENGAKIVGENLQNLATYIGVYITKNNRLTRNLNFSLKTE